MTNQTQQVIDVMAALVLVAVVTTIFRVIDKYMLEPQAGQLGNPENYATLQSRIDQALELLEVQLKPGVVIAPVEYDPEGLWFGLDGYMDLGTNNIHLSVPEGTSDDKVLALLCHELGHTSQLPATSYWQFVEDAYAAWLKGANYARRLRVAETYNWLLTRLADETPEEIVHEDEYFDENLKLRVENVRSMLRHAHAVDINE